MPTLAPTASPGPIARPSRRACIVAALAVPILLPLAGCSPDEDSAYRPSFSDKAPSRETTYVFGVHPLHNPARLFEVYQPLIDLLNSRLDRAPDRPDGRIRFRLEASRNYAAFEDKMARHHFAFALPNPYQTIVSLGQGYRVFGKMADDENFRGIILTRKDGPVARLEDLRGKAIGYPAPTALAATMLPQRFLHDHGIDVTRDIDNRYVGSQESAIMNVYLGTTAAGATWPPPWRTFAREHPDIAAQLDVRWETPSLLNNGLVVRDDVPDGLARAVGAVLFDLHASREGQAILAGMELSRFVPADDATYRPVAEFLDRFARDVRPIGGTP